MSTNPYEDNKKPIYSISRQQKTKKFFHILILVNILPKKNHFHSKKKFFHILILIIFLPKNNNFHSSCDSANVVQANGVYLDVAWDNQFANTSSKGFKQMAAQRAYQLFSLVQIQDDTRTILGECISFLCIRKSDIFGLLNYSLLWKTWFVW